MSKPSNERSGGSSGPCDEWDRAHDDYLAHQARIEEDISDQQRSLDTTLVTLAGGSFGFSLLFASELAAEPVRQPLLLGLAWMMFGLALVLTVFSFVSGVRASMRQLAVHRRGEEYRRQGWVPPSATFHRNRWAAAVTLTNWGALVTFVAGVALLGLFAWRNLL